jgi:hypothetical protein
VQRSRAKLVPGERQTLRREELLHDRHHARGHSVVQNGDRVLREIKNMNNTFANNIF